VLGYEDISIKTMTFSKKTNTQLTKEEYDEMIALKNAIDYDISQVAPEKMEEFSEYLVRSLKERGG
jgi:uncharacterized HAD superfamily protein